MTVLHALLQAIRAIEPLQALARALAQGGPVPGVAEPWPGLPNLGLVRGARLPVAAALAWAHPAPILVLLPDADQALAWAREAELWLPRDRIALLPEPDPMFYDPQPWSAQTRSERAAALAHLATYWRPGAKPTPKLIMTSARAVMARTLPRPAFLRAMQRLRVGSVASPVRLTRAWHRWGYEPVTLVTDVGQFARRGGILDIWPPTSDRPVRIEFFGDEIDRIQHFDPETQRGVAALEWVDIPPAREAIPPEGEAVDDPHAWSESAMARAYPPASALDYLPPQGLVLLPDAHAFRAAVDEAESRALAARDDAVAQGWLEADAPLPYVPWDDLLARLPQGRTLALGPFLELPEEPPTERALHDLVGLRFWFASPERFGGRLTTFLEHVQHWQLGRARVWVLSRQIKRLQGLWKERGYRGPKPVFIEGVAREGVLVGPGVLLGASDPARVHALFTDTEIFGWAPPQARRRPRPVRRPPEQAYADLKPGDYVVHVDYGIGRFRGLVQRATEGVPRDYLLIEYAEGDQLYVPVHQADRITKYIGPDGRPPQITRLGTGQWQQAKARARRAVEALARELLELYARRQMAQGHAFGPDTEWQAELEASFPYEETPDQRRALEAIKRDMERPRPMDRLLCGDVGFGKTEVALRAAFKAVMDGKQVAILVPTTILAQQHYRTFRERLAPFPVEVEMLSRFRSPRQQEDILFRLAQGAIDIIIGTHRLLSPDVQFKDLGLVIIDEEHRFGVTHKEHFKRLRTQVDVLTLSATPIPRTLYMALSGLRDISVINTPPAERQPVVTHVGPYDEALVRRAIERELARGGQVFFVHNRVDTIYTLRERLQALLPHARIAIAHGQMSERTLARVMERFAQGEIDVLLSTTIIEAGLDFPRANTLIVDRADTFGLAQLYQLRGRIGRGRQRGYAYFFWSPTHEPRPEARQRLEVLAEHSYLGAGMQIALRDLEIRGAGELLGTRQHGHMAAVGFHLYTRLLAETVRQLREAAGLPEPEDGDVRPQPAEPVSVDLPLAVGLPADYVPDVGVRLGLYRRLAEVRTLDEVDAFAAELRDRFGPLPPDVENLLYQVRVKVLAQAAGLASVGYEAGQVVLRPRTRGGATKPTLLPLPRPWRLGRTSYWLPMDAEAAWKSHLLDGLRRLAQATASTKETSS